MPRCHSCLKLHLQSTPAPRTSLCIAHNLLLALSSSHMTCRSIPSYHLPPRQPTRGESHGSSTFILDFLSLVHAGMLRRVTCQGGPGPDPAAASRSGGGGPQPLTAAHLHAR